MEFWNGDDIPAVPNGLINAYAWLGAIAPQIYVVTLLNALPLHLRQFSRN